jgi:hypothetical protein
VLAIVAAITGGALMPRWWLAIATINRELLQPDGEEAQCYLRFKMSLLGRYCCKSRKSNHTENFAKAVF